MNSQIFGLPQHFQIMWNNMGLLETREEEKNAWLLILHRFKSPVRAGV
jgi:hypothetical protein